MNFSGYWAVEFMKTRILFGFEDEGLDTIIGLVALEEISSAIEKKLESMACLSKGL